MHGFDQWVITYTDGTQITSLDTEWSAITTLRQIGNTSLYVTMRPVRALSVIVEQEGIQMDADAVPSQTHDVSSAHAFRLYHSRIGTDGIDELVGYDFGLIYPEQHLVWRLTVDLLQQRIHETLYTYTPAASISTQ